MNREKFYEEAEKLGIGNTPLIPYEEDFEADIFVKNEAMNASGSVKDRAALAMVPQPMIAIFIVFLRSSIFLRQRRNRFQFPPLYHTPPEMSSGL